MMLDLEKVLEFGNIRNYWKMDIMIVVEMKLVMDNDCLIMDL